MTAVDRVGGVLVETYRLERLIAEGSMGSVYEARHLRIPKRFAVKFLRIGLEENPEALERFRREAEVVAALEHPNIVEVYDYNVADDGSPYIVLEYLDGEHLGARLRRDGKLPLDEALRIVGDVSAALEVAHARDVIHRDLKPENIVLCSDGEVKVVDFGVAKMRGAPELTAVNTIVGTVPYMAPEQLLGGVLDGRVDEYALAVIAYELLSGEMAFDGTGAVADVARRVLTHVPPFLAGVPQAVNEVLFRGMARAADDRFAVGARVFHGARAGGGGQGAVPARVQDRRRAAAARRRRHAHHGPRRCRHARRGGRGRRRGSAGAAARGRGADEGAADADDHVARAGARRRDLRDAGGGGAERQRRHGDAGATGAAVAVDAGGAEAVGRADADAEDASAADLPARAPEEPRVTLKTMKAATAPGWEEAAGDKTKSVRVPTRLLLVLLGIFVGIGAALVAVYLAD